LVDLCNTQTVAKLVRCRISTPSEYISALKKENVEWPVKDGGDFFPYGSDEKKNFWAGYFTSRPALKKQIKDASANYHSSNKLFATKVISSTTTDKEVKAIMEAQNTLLDALGIA